MQTHVYLRPSKKALEQQPGTESTPSPGAAANATRKTIHVADPHLVAVPRRNPERILNNEAVGFVDKKGPPLSDL